MPRRGFTLIELLVVIGVIATLSAIAIPAIGFAQRKARDAKCQTLIGQVKAGLETFRTNIGTYPEGPAGRSANGGLSAIASTDSATSWSMGFGRGDDVKPVDTITDGHWHTVNASLRNLLAMVSGEEFRTSTSTDPCPVCGQPVRINDHIYDPYGTAGVQMVLRYRPARYFRFDSTAKNVIDQDDPPGRDSYQLWSCGRDGIDQYGAKDSDDITSWEKR